MPKFSDLSADSSPHPDDYIAEVDVHDTSMASTGTNKRLTLAKLGRLVTGWADLVRDYGADPTGTSSIATPLADACSDATAAQPAPFGLTVPPGLYKMTTSQDLPYNLVLRCAGAAGGTVTGQYTGSVFRVASSFAGSYVFGFKDTPHVSGFTGTNGAVVSGIFLDGGAYTGGSAIDGFYIYGPTMCEFRNIRIARMTGWGINASGVDGSMGEQFPFGQSWSDVEVDSCGTVSGGGFNLVGCEDSVFERCYSIGNNNGPGFHVQACDNTKFIACNSEWNGTHGYHVTGDWQYFTGGCQFIGCSTDSNTQDGFHIDATWTTGGGAGTGPCIINLCGCHTRRDGQGTAIGTGTYAGVSFGATTLPVIITGLSQTTDIGDGGAGTMTPNFGIYFSQTSYSQPILIGPALAWGYTAALRTTTTSNAWPSGAVRSNVVGVTGNNYAPVYGSVLT